MPRSTPAVRRRVVAVFAAAVAMLTTSVLAAMPALARARGYAAEITKIELAEKRVTLKASMGQQTMRVGAGVALHSLKVGDKVLITFGQDGSEAIITGIELRKP